MHSALFGRALGSSDNQNIQRSESFRLLRCLSAAPDVIFDGRIGTKADTIQHNNVRTTNVAHSAGVNCIAIDRFEGRLLISGGSDSSVLLWDLEDINSSEKRSLVHAKDSSEKTASHRFGITDLSFYPFDAQAFLSSSYDHKLRIYATQTLATSASFDLDSVIYSHALSLIADHLLVACATQHHAVRLVDLRSGASTHSLAGHSGSVLSVAWSPKDEHILASGGSDGTARLWDVRRSAGSLGVLDMDDSIGIVGEDGLGKNARPRERGKAHAGSCNGVVWTDDAKNIVTTGHDERVRCWEAATGANALSHFGPIIRNSHHSTLLPLLVPHSIVPAEKQVMIYPNEKEILMFDLFDGTLLRRLRVPKSSETQFHGGVGQRDAKSRITSLAWRANDVEIYSAHTDGAIRAWMPQTQEELDLIAEETLESHGGEDESRKRKREALDQVFRDLTKQKITFT